MNPQETAADPKQTEDETHHEIDDNQQARGSDIGTVTIDHTNQTVTMPDGGVLSFIEYFNRHLQRPPRSRNEVEHTWLVMDRK
jgi:hypothetical protein